MTEEKSEREKAREIVSLLPKENCGKCGFENCGKFALAVAKGEASPFGCHNNPSAGYEINKVLGVETSEKVGVPAVPSESYQQGRRHDGAHRFGHHGHGFGHGKDGRGHRHSGRHHTKL